MSVLRSVRSLCQRIGIQSSRASSPLVSLSARFTSTAIPELRYKRLLYQSQQRGWLELDLIMGSWAVKNKSRLVSDPTAMDKLEVICKEENSDLMRWFCEGKPVPEKYASDPLMKELLDYAYSPNKPWSPRPGDGNQ